MFTSLLPEDEDYRVHFSDYAGRHFVKRFSKSYKSKQWLVTYDSIFQDLKRVHALQQSQQVDQLRQGDGCLLFKYDFAIAQTRVSPKASGNRCAVFLDTNKLRQDVLIVYGKTDLPKNMPETHYIMKIVKSEFPEFWSMLD